MIQRTIKKSIIPMSINNRAFTLMDLLVSVIVIATLAAICVPNFLEAQVRSKVSRANSDMHAVTIALETYRVDYGRYPRQYQRINNMELQFLYELMKENDNNGYPGLYTKVEKIVTGSQPINENGEATLVPTPINDPMMGMPGDPFGPPGMSPFRMQIGPMRTQQSRKPNADGLTIDDLATSAVLAQINFRYSPIINNGLNSLTTPVCYISGQILRDPFSNGTYFGRSWWTGSALDFDPIFKYINLSQINPDGYDISGMGSNLPWIIFSDGPANYMNLMPFPPVSPVLSYDPTNGTVSAGTIYQWPH